MASSSAAQTGEGPGEWWCTCLHMRVPGHARMHPHLWPSLCPPAVWTLLSLSGLPLCGWGRHSGLSHWLHGAACCRRVSVFPPIAGACGMSTHVCWVAGACRQWEAPLRAPAQCWPGRWLLTAGRWALAELGRGVSLPHGLRAPVEAVLVQESRLCVSCGRRPAPRPVASCRGLASPWMVLEGLQGGSQDSFVFLSGPPGLHAACQRGYSGGDGERSPAGFPAGGCLAHKLKDPYNLELKALTFEFRKIFYVRLLICRSPSNQRWWQKPGPCGDKGRHVRSGSRPRCLPHFVRWEVARLPIWAELCGWGCVCGLFLWSVVVSPSQAA